MANPTRRPGRPPSGPAGEPVSRYPQMTIRIPRETKDQLQALATLRRIPAWKVVDEAVRAFVQALRDAERRVIEKFAERMPE